MNILKILLGVLLFIIPASVVLVNCQNDVLVDGCGGLPPPSTSFVLLDANEKNLIKSNKDQVLISYPENGIIKYVPNSIFKIRASNSDTATTSKYGGLGVGSEISSFSVRQNKPIKTFQISINGQSIGSIYYDMQKGNVACYELMTFKFNGVDVVTDKTVMPFVNIVHVNP